MSDSIVRSEPTNNPLQFMFEDHPVRVMKDENGEPVFVASDVCNALDVVNVGNALARLDEDEKDNIRLPDAIGRVREIAVVTEPGLYSLIMRSDKPKAKAFKRWIIHEVLPAIRKHGGYAMQNLSPMQILRQMFNAIELQEQRLDDHAERITSLETHVQTDVEYFTVTGYFRKMGLNPPTLNEAQSIGQRASHLSRVRSYGIGKTSDPRYGEVNTYHQDILKEIVG